MQRKIFHTENSSITSNIKNFHFMITIIPDTPENVAAFKASGEITREGF